MSFKYATLPNTPEAFAALQNDLTNNMQAFFASNFVSSSDLVCGDLEQFNGSKFINPSAQLNYLIKYAEGLENLQSVNVLGFQEITDFENWLKTNSIL